MRYSIDLRKSVLTFANNGGSKAEAERTFGVSRQAIYNWLAAEDPFTYQKPGPKGPRDMDYDALRKYVAEFPDKTLVERAEHFGVSKGCISYAFEKLNITRKKTLTYKQQCPVKRQSYLEAFWLEVEVGGKTPVYVDESGFASTAIRRYADAPKGIKVEDKISGSHRYTSTSLMAARIGERLTAPLLFEGTSDAGVLMRG